MILKEANEVRASDENTRLVAEKLAEMTGVDGKPGVTWISGGAVRDELIGKNSNDIDLLTTVDAADAAKIFDEVEVTHTKNCRLVKGVINGDMFELGCLKEGMSAADNLNMRDLTCNAVLKNVLTGEYYDPIGGMKDIKAKQLRFTPASDEAARAGTTPIHITRIFRFVSVLGWDIASESQEALKVYAAKTGGKIKQKAGTASLESNWRKLIKGPHKDKAFQYLKDLGFGQWAAEMFPNDFSMDESASLKDKVAILTEQVKNLQMRIAARKKPYINEGGNVSMNGHEAQKMDISVLEDSEYDAFRQDIIKMLAEMNDRLKNDYDITLYKNLGSLKAGKYFSGSTEQFYAHDKDEFVPYKKTLGDIDTQVDSGTKTSLKSALNELVGEKFNGFELVGTKYGADYNNLFVPPSKYHKVSNCIQVDFEFVGMDDAGELTKFDKFNKNSSYIDLKNGIKGLFKIGFISDLFKTKYEMDGVVFQNKKDAPSKAAEGKTLSKFTFGNKGVRQKYNPVMGADGKQVKWEGKLAYRINDMVEDGNEKDLEKIFNQLFEADYTDENAELFDSYTGLVQLVSKYWDKTNIERLNGHWHKYVFKMASDRDAYERIMKLFYESCNCETKWTYEDAKEEADGGNSTDESVKVEETPIVETVKPVKKRNLFSDYIKSFE